jgi:hypothetical protein
MHLQNLKGVIFHSIISFYRGKKNKLVILGQNFQRIKFTHEVSICYFLLTFNEMKITETKPITQPTLSKAIIPATFAEKGKN